MLSNIKSEDVAKQSPSTGNEAAKDNHTDNGEKKGLL